VFCCYAWEARGGGGGGSASATVPGSERADGAEWSEPRTEGIVRHNSSFDKKMRHGTRRGIERRSDARLEHHASFSWITHLFHFQVRASDLTQRLYWFSRGLSISPSSNWDHINIEQQKPDSEPR
jgi:hypothetical protein